MIGWKNDPTDEIHYYFLERNVMEREHNVSKTETSGQKSPHGTAYKVSGHENGIDTIGGRGAQFKDTGLIAELDTLHADIDKQNSGNDTDITVSTPIQ